MFGFHRVISYLCKLRKVFIVLPISILSFSLPYETADLELVLLPKRKHMYVPTMVHGLKVESLEWTPVAV